MPIDKCANPFTELATTTLPSHMALMRQAMNSARPMSEFCTPGVGIATNLSALGHSVDFSGCYVLLHDGRPLYVGIWRGVTGRLTERTRRVNGSRLIHSGHPGWMTRAVSFV